MTPFAPTRAGRSNLVVPAATGSFKAALSTSMTSSPSASAGSAASPSVLGLLPPPVRRGLEAILLSYSQVLFSRSRLVGLLVMAATFVVPEVGLVGLAGVALAATISTVAKLDREATRTGVLGYNALLVFLMIGAALEQSTAFWILAAVVAAVVVLAHVALSTALGYHFRLPVLSLPFVLVGWLALAAVPYVRGMSVREVLPALELGAFPGPESLDILLRSLGAIFFQPHWTAGLLVLAALLLHSRIATFHALVGFGVAMLADAYLFSFPPEYLYLYVGFNFVVTAIALGGVFYVPGPASLGLAAFGSLAAGFLSVGMIRLLQPMGLPVLALPFNVIVLVTLYALGQRALDARPRRVDFIAGSPEENLNHWRTRVERFRTSLPIRLQLPFRGAWVVTQGHDGEHTHQGAWRHGLDFEVADRKGKRHKDTGEGLEDWLCYRLPVLAPAAGTVVSVVDGLPDQRIGDVDTERNWGNLVVLHHAAGVYSLMAHLSPGTIPVKEGDVVTAGQKIGQVGSSGRAPVPHLHFQLQATPTVGDPTIPCEFHGIVVENGVSEVLSRMVPLHGDRMRNLVRAEPVARALALPPGERLQATVRVDGVERVEELISDIDALGNRSLVSPSRDARLWFENRGDSFVVYDHVGPKDGALFAWYAALGRLPLEDGADLDWTDHLNPRRLGTTSLGWLRDAAAALVPPPQQPVSWQARRADGALVVEGRSPATRSRRPVRTRAVIEPAEGVRSLTVAIGDRRVEVEIG
jgi:urea transporter